MCYSWQFRVLEDGLLCRVLNSALWNIKTPVVASELVEEHTASQPCHLRFVFMNNRQVNPYRPDWYFFHCQEWSPYCQEMWNLMTYSGLHQQLFLLAFWRPRPRAARQGQANQQTGGLGVHYFSFFFSFLDAYSKTIRITICDFFPTEIFFVYFFITLSLMRFILFFIFIVNRPLKFCRP